MDIHRIQIRCVNNIHQHPRTAQFYLKLSVMKNFADGIYTDLEVYSFLNKNVKLRFFLLFTVCWISFGEQDKYKRALVSKLIFGSRKKNNQS